MCFEVNGIIFKFSFCIFVTSILSTIDFYILTLYSAALLNLLNNSNSLSTDSFGFSKYSILLPPNNDSFISYFPIHMPFISFSGLAAMTRTSNAMLYRSGDSRHPTEKAFNISPLSMMFALSYL